METMRQELKYIAVMASMLVAVSTLCGCGGGSPGDAPDLGQVKGVVTLDGKPVAGATINFTPEGGGASSTAVTDEQGNYELRYIRDEMGAKVGKHRVMISTFQEAEITDEGKREGGRKEEIPKIYNIDSTMMKDVAAGEQTINLELTSG